MPALACRFCDASDRCVGARLLQQRRPRRRLVQIRTHGICARIESGFTDPGSRHITRRRLHVQAHTASLQLAAVDSPAPHKQPVALLWLAVSLGFAVSRWTQLCLWCYLGMQYCNHVIQLVNTRQADYGRPVRWSPQWQGCVLLLLEGLYAILHLYPLLHLVNFIGPAAAEHFMHAMTRAQYFGTELWLLAMLICCVPLRCAA